MPATQQGRPAVWVVLCLCAIGVGRAQSDELARKSHEAKQLMAAGRFVEAIPLYQELGRALPSNTGLRLNLRLAYHMTGRQAEAVPEFERVLKSDPGNGPALISLGVALLELNQPAKAVAPLEKVVAAQPSHAEARGCSRMRFYRWAATGRPPPSSGH